jgi:hypothetical protein
VTARDSPYGDHPLRAYTVEEAADILSCEPGWLEELARQGKIAHAVLADSCHFSGAHLAAIVTMHERLPASAPATAPVSTPRAWNTEEAAALLRCKASWLKEQARHNKIPYVRLSGSYHFTDNHLTEIIRIFEVQPRKVTPPSAPRNPVLREPAPGREYVALTARPPRTSRKRGNP